MSSDLSTAWSRRSLEKLLGGPYHAARGANQHLGLAVTCMSILQLQSALKSTAKSHSTGTVFVYRDPGYLTSFFKKKNKTELTFSNEES